MWESTVAAAVLGVHTLSGVCAPGEDQASSKSTGFTSCMEHETRGNPTRGKATHSACTSRRTGPPLKPGSCHATAGHCGSSPESLFKCELILSETKSPGALVCWLTGVYYMHGTETAIAGRQPVSCCVAACKRTLVRPERTRFSGGGPGCSSAAFHHNRVTGHPAVCLDTA